MDCENIDRMHGCPLPPATHFKGKKRHHHRHSPSPPHHRRHHHHHHHFVQELRHSSPPPPRPPHHNSHFVELRHESTPPHPRHHPHYHFVELRHSSSPPPHPQHHNHHFVELRHESSPPPPPPPPPPRHERGKLFRVKLPSKHLKKVRKLHHLLMRSCKLPKGRRHGHKRHHMHLPPATSEGELFSTQAGDHQHPPGCCLHCSPSYEMGYGHPPQYRRRHKRSPMCSLVKPEVVKSVARVNPAMAAPPAEPPIEVGAPPVTTTKPTAEEATLFDVAP